MTIFGGNLPRILPGRLAGILASLKEGLLVPDEFWDMAQLPAAPAERALSLAYLGVSAHFRQIICWQAISLSGDARLPSAYSSTIALPYENAALARDLVAGLVGWLAMAGADDPRMLASIIARVSASHRKHLSGMVSKSILGFTALRLSYPVFGDAAGNLVVGQGARGRLFHGLYTDRSSMIGAQLCDNKAFTAIRLRAAGLPAARHLPASTEAEALAAATSLGYPVVVKPADQERGKGVQNNLHSPQEVREAWQGARKFSEAILVEKHVDGFTHRLTVVADEVVNVVRRRPGGVTGDGVSTIRQLVDTQNAEPSRLRRRQRDGRPTLAVDKEAVKLLQRRGLEASSVVAEGHFVALRSRDNVRAGGTSSVIPLDDVHPDNLMLAINATQVMVMDIAGVDLIVPDISRSWREQACCICEVNGNPELGFSAKSRPFETILSRLVATSPDDARIPLDLHVMSDAHWAAGTRPGGIDTEWYCDAAGICRRDRFVAGPFADGYSAARTALANRSVTELAMAMSAGDLLQHGLASSKFRRIAIDPRIDHARLEAIMALCADHAPDVAVTD